MTQRLFAVLMMLVCALPARADDARTLYDVMRIDALIDIMRTEGLAHGQSLGRDMLGAGPNPGWAATVDTIYDADRMSATVQTLFVDALEGVRLDPVLDFFESDTGQEVITLELAAREALMDEMVEDAARARYQEIIDDGGSERFDRLTAFIEANDLIERNIAGTLNASLQFYTGLVDGGAIAMTESDILREVWGSEPDTREDTTEWVYGYMLLAYRPLDDDGLEAYIAVSGTEEGAALNSALFEAFNTMYDDISYALGRAVSEQMSAQEL